MQPLNASFYDSYDGENIPTSQFQPQNQLAKVEIVSLAMIPTGTYNQQFQRPWVANYNLDNANEMNQIVAQSYHQYQNDIRNGKVNADQHFNLTPELVASASSNFIQPTAQYESPVAIANGWNEQRVSWVMHLRAHTVGMGPQTYILTGYTDVMGVSAAGNIAPEMQMIVNAVYETRVVNDITPTGMQARTVLSNASQVLSNYQYRGDVDTRVQMRMRPQDVIGAINVLHVPDLANGAVEVVDLRAQQTTTPVKSNFQHTNHNNYLATIVAGLVSGDEMARAQNRHQNAYDLAAAAVADQTVNRDPFMRMIASVRGTAATNQFQFKDLIELDQNVLSDQITKVFWRGRPEVVGMGAPGEDFHQANATQGWHGADRLTMVANMIANSMPSMMASLLIGGISIHATNRGPGGMPFMMHSSLDSLIPGIDAMPQQAEILKEQFRIHLLNDITHNNGIGYDIAVTAHLMGEIWISLSLDGYPPVDFVMPSYANSMMAPVITRNRQNLNNLASQFSELKNNVLRPDATVAAGTQFFLPSGRSSY